MLNLGKLCRDHAIRGSVDGWGLLNSLTTDLLRSVLGSAFTDKGAETHTGKVESWTFVSSLMTEQSKGNLMGEKPHLGC